MMYHGEIIFCSTITDKINNQKMTIRIKAAKVIHVQSAFVWSRSPRLKCSFCLCVCILIYLCRSLNSLHCCNNIYFLGSARSESWIIDLISPSSFPIKSMTRIKNPIMSENGQLFSSGFHPHALFTTVQCSVPLTLAIPRVYSNTNVTLSLKCARYQLHLSY